MTKTEDGLELNNIVSVEEAIDDLTWENVDQPDRIGLELEAFPVVTRLGVPRGRLPLRGPHGVVATVASSLGKTGQGGGSAEGPRPAPGGGRITFEPGGQIELSTAPSPDIPSLRGQVDAAWDRIQAGFLERDVSLVCLGVDPWHHIDHVPQQLTAGRYLAMDRYFAGRWPAGAVMMRNTCSLQMNVESGTGPVREQRWLAANLMSPVLSAMFSTSPGRDGSAGRRAKVWQSMDPTRTGFPAWKTVEDARSARDVGYRALAASVMFVVRGGVTIPVSPGWSFESWIRSPHPVYGSPTVSDLRVHLSTLFSEVRPRAGLLELRGVDALPRRWWMVPPTVVGAVLFDEDVRSQVIELLSPLAGRLDQVWRRAADRGLDDPELAAMAGKLGQLALVSAVAGIDRFDAGAIEATEVFLDTFTMRGRAPGDVIRSMLNDPGDALEWALAEPVMRGS